MMLSPVKIFKRYLKRFSYYSENCTENRASLVENDVYGQRQNKSSGESLCHVFKCKVVVQSYINV